MKIKYISKTKANLHFNRKIFLASCKNDGGDKPTCLLKTGICKAKDDRELLQKWIMSCELHRFDITNFPLLSRSHRCILCGKQRKAMLKHLEKAHGGSKGLRRWNEAKAQAYAYRELVLPLLRLGLWAFFPILPNGCPLCGKKTVKKLEDGTPHKKPWRCVRFESTRSKFWSLGNFGLEAKRLCPKFDVVEPKKVSVFILCEKGSDSCKISKFAKKF